MRAYLVVQLDDGTPTGSRSTSFFIRGILGPDAWSIFMRWLRRLGEGVSGGASRVGHEVVRSLPPGKCLRYLTCNPFGRGICCDVDPDEVSAVEPDNDEGIEQVETDSWNNEQVHGGDVRRVVTQEGPPSLAGWPPSFDHVLGDARLCDFKPELEQFAVDARRTPKRILHAHSPDQYAEFRVDLR